jgi:phosphoglycolate phosphatase
MIKCAVLDFDGTLVQSNEIKRQAFFSIAAELDWPGEFVEDVLAIPEIGDRYSVFETLVKNIEAKYGLPLRQARSSLESRLVKRYNAVCETKISACPEVPGAMIALKHLFETGYRVYVSSATPDDQLATILKRRKFVQYISGAFGSSNDKINNLLKILEKEQLTAAEVIVIGDSDDDLQSANTIGCHFLGIELNPHAASPRFSVRPHYVTDTLENLPDMFDHMTTEFLDNSSSSESLHD